MPCTELGAWNVAMDQIEVVLNLRGVYLDGAVGRIDNTQTY